MSCTPFVIIAHRGNSSQSPENTVEAFDLALSQGFQHFETDCQLTKDGACIILHDEKLGRTTTGLEGDVADHEWSALQDLDAGSWFKESFKGCHIPTLEALLVRYRTTSHIHLELKSKQDILPAKVAELVKQHMPQSIPSASQPAEQHLEAPGLTITSFHLSQLERSLQVMRLALCVVRCCPLLPMDGWCKRLQSKYSRYQLTMPEFNGYIRARLALQQGARETRTVLLG